MVTPLEAFTGRKSEMKIATRACAVLVMGAVAYGCSSTSGGINGTGGTSGSGGGSSSYTVPTLSQACQSFDQAFCAYVAKCDPQDTTCAQSIFFCASDSAAQSCTAALPTATCGGSVAACQGVAATQPAVDFCNAFVSEYCSIALKCGDAGGTMQDCTTALSGSQGFNCSTAVAVGKSAQQCLNDLATGNCNYMSTAPDSCKQVVITSGSSADAGPPPDAGVWGPVIWVDGIPVSVLRSMRRVVNWPKLW